MRPAQIVSNAFCGILLGALTIPVLLLAGCRGIPTTDERVAQQKLKQIDGSYAAQNHHPKLPELKPQDGLGNYLQFAMLNQPQVAVAYFDWAASVQRITVERSLPDPRLTFESDIAEAVMTVMPGLMQEFPGPGKLRLQARAATAESQARYFTFENSVLMAAFYLKRAYYQLHFLSERIRINKETLTLLGDLETIARTQNEVGKVTLQDVLRAQIEQDRVATDIANLDDSRNPLLAQFKSALGLTVHDNDPPVPTVFESTPLDLGSEKLLAEAFARNPRLKAMEADVRRAEVSLGLAYKTRVPDFSAGLMADVKAAPVMFRPLFGMTLPIWRDKIAAEIAQAQAGKQASEARLTVEQIQLTVDFAEKSFAYREITRNLQLLQEKLIPKARKSLEIARAGYLAGQIDFFNLIDAERTLLNFQLNEVEARTQREIVLAELSLIILGAPPAGAPILLPQNGATGTEPNKPR